MSIKGQLIEELVVERDNLAKVLSELVSVARLVSLKYNATELYEPVIRADMALEEYKKNK